MVNPKGVEYSSHVQTHLKLVMCQELFIRGQGLPVRNPSGILLLCFPCFLSLPISLFSFHSWAFAMRPKFHGLGWPSGYGSSAPVCWERFGPPTSHYTLGGVVRNTSPIHRETQWGFCVPIPVIGLVTTVGFYMLQILCNL